MGVLMVGIAWRINAAANVHFRIAAIGLCDDADTSRADVANGANGAAVRSACYDRFWA
jgi:hypothetical protein